MATKPGAVAALAVLLSMVAGCSRGADEGPAAPGAPGAPGVPAGQPGAAPAPAPAGQVADPPPRVRLETDEGSIVIELAPEKAPITVENFLRYVDSGFYAGTIFHRVKKDFMVQGGGFSAVLEEKPTGPPIKNEADNGLPNLRGTVAMARTAEVNSATAQFFINVVDNDGLDHRSDDPADFGYCVFGHVVEGMDVVDRIRHTPTTRRGVMHDVPRQPIVIRKAERIR